MTASSAIAPAAVPSRERRRTLGVSCGAHALHDGFTDLIYVLLPIWQAQFGLGYAQVGALRALYAGTTATFQVPAGMLAERTSPRTVLAAGTALAALGYLLAGASTGFALLAAALVVGGLGSSVQHPVASSLVAHAYDGHRSRAALGTYNFAGDLGKMALPALTALLVAWLSWRPTVTVLGLAGLAGAAAILLLAPRPQPPAAPAAAQGNDAPAAATAPPPRGGFSVLLAIGVIDSATRMGFLTFLPFLLQGKGANLPTIGVALTLVFAGGAAGKLACGFLGERFGVLRTVWLTEGFTAVGIAALLALPLAGTLVLLPLVGLALNGTSSVLYGTVPELVTRERRARAFGVFYTATIGAGAIAPVFYGLFSDALGVPAMMLLVAAVVLATLPLAWLLRPALAPAPGGA
jgi:MFS family permease